MSLDHALAQRAYGCEMAGTFSRRLHAFCAKQGIPIIEAQARDRKHELAQPYEPNDPKFCGSAASQRKNSQARTVGAIWAPSWLHWSLPLLLWHEPALIIHYKLSI